MNQAETSNFKPELQGFSNEEIRAYVEARVAQEAAKGKKVSLVCGVIEEAGDPTNGLNLRVQQEIIRAMAAAIRERS